MKHRAIILALAGATTALPGGAQAADDICSRLIIQAINQFCQLLPNGSSLCQPIALVGPSAECKAPERQAVVPVPLGPPTLQPLAPWAAPYGYAGMPTHSPAAPAAMSPFVTAPLVPKMPSVPLPVASPQALVEAPRPASASAPAAGVTAAAAQGAVAPTPAVTPPSAAAVEVAAVPAAATLSAEPPGPTAPVSATAVAPSEPAPPTTTPAPASAPVTSVPAAVATSEVPATAPPATEVAASVPPVAAEAGIAAAMPIPREEDAKAVDALAHFDFDSAVLTEVGRAVLDAWLAEAPKDKTIRVSGYADRLGPEPYNLKLSLRRADAVKQYLIGKGMNPRRVEIEARGEADPVKRCKGDATPTTKACLAPNRRVIIEP